MRREAVLSSHIEGTWASLPDLYAYEARQLAFYQPAPDVHEVYNYVQVLEYGLERLASLPMSLRLIRDMHGRLLEGVCGERQIAALRVGFASRKLYPEGCKIPNRQAMAQNELL